MTKPTAIVYIDGFNLYRRALEKTEYKWLNLLKMSSMILSNFDVSKVRYFTADLRHSPINPGQELRQNVYLRALASIPEIEIHKGKFRQDVREMLLHPLEFDASGEPKRVKVKKFEEKGSDVNLASNLLLDAFKQSADIYVILSNDTDLVEPLKILRHELNAKIGVIFPSERHAKALLQLNLDLVRTLRRGVLEASQLPREISFNRHTIRKPDVW